MSDWHLFNDGYFYWIINSWVMADTAVHRRAWAVWIASGSAGRFQRYIIALVQRTWHEPGRWVLDRWLWTALLWKWVWPGNCLDHSVEDFHVKCDEKLFPLLPITANFYDIYYQHDSCLSMNFLSQLCHMSEPKIKYIIIHIFYLQDKISFVR